jgi:hypothetical protein
VKLDAEQLRMMVAEDEFGLLAIPVKPAPMSGEDRLLASFNEIVDFVVSNGREPKRNRKDMAESKLAMRLQALIGNDEQREELREFDAMGLLTEPEPPASLADVFADDDMDLLSDGADLHALKHVPESQGAPDRVARREPCTEFDLFKDLFVQCQQDLRDGKRKLLPFRNPSFIEAGKFFVQGGVLVFVAEVGELKQRGEGKDGRTRCIYENGTEADLLLRSLARLLYEEGRIVTEPDNSTAERMGLLPETEMGSLYILRSLSDDDQVAGIEDLHKIGATTQTLGQRLAGAQKHPTFLNAEVEVLAEYQVPAAVALAVEKILHDFFSAVRLDIWFEREGVTVAEAREWFDVPLRVVDEAVRLIEAETITEFRYDSAERQIVLK